jgi:hypothetical protein
MPWTTPDTRAAGDVLSAANYNTYLRDNLTYLHSGRPALLISHAVAPYSTTSATFTPIDSLALAGNLTLSTGRVLITFTGCFYADAPSRLLALDMEIDGARIGGTDGLCKEALNGDVRVVSFATMRAGLTPGGHAFRLLWRMSSGIGHLLSGPDVAAHLTIAEW